MLLLLTAHLSLNYAAVRSVSMHSLNRQRASILFSHLLTSGQVLTPGAVAHRERIFDLDGALRWSNDQVIGFARVGVSFEDVAASVNHPSDAKNAPVGAAKLEQLLGIFKDEDYISWFDTRTTNAMILLKKGIEPSSQLKAVLHAVCVAERLSGGGQQNESADAIFEVIAASLTKTSKLFEDHKQAIINAGWRLDIASLEIQSGVRLVCMA